MRGSAVKPGQPLVSVVIPVYNGAATIERCLDSVLAQRAPFVFEVIVADSSTDDTAKIVRERFPWVKLVRLGQRAFPGTARNAAIAVATAPYVAMTDADCIVASDWLARMIDRHERGGYAAVGGAICNGTPFSPSGFIGYMLEFREFIPKSPLRDVMTIPTANLCCRREIFDRFGFFDDVRASEDILFNWRLVLAGERILFDPKIRVTHLNRTGFAKVVKYQSVLGHGSATARQIMNPPFEVLRVYPALGWLLPYLMKYPRLGVLVPPVRLGRALSWLAKYDWPALALLVLLWPAYLAGAFTWAMAFVRALSAERERGSPGGAPGGAPEPGVPAVSKKN
jgi:glycosyltransferase involved in cell wall biosynthesis